ncbi:MAG: carbohydrate binding domain-containing protein [Clostridia bacterium]|nr:carbohydrate binding domain-containing protein [Clostridia bacterium]
MRKFLKILALALALTCMATAAFADTTLDLEDGVNVFVQSGSCSPAVTTDNAHSGAYALAVTQRTTNDWDAADLPFDLVGLKAGDTVSISFWTMHKGSAAGEIQVGKAGGNYATLVSKVVEPNVWTKVSGEFVVDGDPLNLRFKTDASLVGVDYYVDDIVVATYDNTVEYTVVADYNFDDNVNPGFFQSGTATIAVENGAVSVTQRTTNDWDSTDFPYETLGLQAGDTVKVSFMAMHKGSAAGQIQVGNGGGNYATLIAAEVQPDVWTEVSGEFVVGESPINLRFKTDAALIGADYYIDDLKIATVRPAVTTYSYAYDFEDGANPGFFQSGSCTIGVADGALTITQRATNNWDAADLGAADLKIAAGDTVKVTFDVYHTGSEAGEVALGEGGGSYANLIAATVEPKTWTTLSGEYVQSEKAPNLRFKLGDSLVGVDYMIDNVKIEVVKPYLIKTYTNDLEGGIGAFIQSGSCSVVAATNANSGAGAVGCEQRTTNDWDAIDLLLAETGIQAGDHVKMSFYLYADTNDAGDWGVGEGGGSYATLISANIPGKTWTKIEGEFDVSEKAPNLRFKSMSEEMKGVSFYVDDISIEYWTVPADPDADIITAVAGLDYDTAAVNEIAGGHTFQTIYDGVYVYTKVFVADTTDEKGDVVSVFIDGVQKMVKRSKGEEVEGGYVVTVKQLYPAAQGDKLKYDVCVTDVSTGNVSWAGSEVIDATETHVYGRVLMGPTE